ncbi:MAG: ComF family protein [Deltaproteobacteria bacterium]|nr:ComF family protein [Deltaproteobacteria bacterium]
MNFLDPFIDIIFPPRCHICQAFLGRERTPAGLPPFLRPPACPPSVWRVPPSFQGQIPICHACFREFVPIGSPLCPICGTPFQEGLEEDRVCENCLRKKPFFDKAGAPYVYEGPVMTAIHRFKYAGKTHLADSLGPLLVDFVRNWLPETANLLVMPVPLHPKRLRELGFNQALLLSRHISASLGLELDFLSLRRVKYTEPQAGLPSDERRKNVRRAFRVVNPVAVKKRDIILVDDVATTGNTLNECAQALKKSGAAKVYGAVLARTFVS